MLLCEQHHGDHSSPASRLPFHWLAQGACTLPDARLFLLLPAITLPSPSRCSLATVLTSRYGSRRLGGRRPSSSRSMSSMTPWCSAGTAPLRTTSARSAP